MNKSEKSKINEYSANLLDSNTTKIVNEMIKSGPSHVQIIKFKISILRKFAWYRSHSFINGKVTSFRRKIRRKLGYWIPKYLDRPMASGSTHPDGGILIAFVGPDGAGKSTQCKRIKSSLSSYETYDEYFGDRSIIEWTRHPLASIVKFPFEFIWRVFLTIEKLAELFGGYEKPTYENPKADITQSDPDHSNWRKKLKPLWWGARSLMISVEKRSKLSKAWRARNRGFLVFADRYPQNQSPGMNDGPQLYYLRGSKSMILRWIAKWEAKPYDWADNHPPDVVVKLNVSPKIAAKREKEYTERGIQNIIDSLEEVEFKNATVIEVNSDKDMDKVTEQILSEIWEIL